MPSEPKKAYEPFLKELGFEYHPVKCRPRMMTVKEFRRDFKETAICNVKVGYGSHFVAVHDGQVFDTWDSSEQKMYVIIRKEKGNNNGKEKILYSQTRKKRRNL